MRFVVLLLLSGCNQIYGLDRTHVIEPDATPPLVMPPPGPTTCGPLPDFEAWTYTRHDLPPSVALFDVSTYADRAVVIARSTANELWDVGLDGTAPIHLDVLDPPSGIAFRDPAMAPDGSVLWFRQTGASGVVYAARADNWRKVDESFGLVNLLALYPGTPGFHDGTIRMPVIVQEDIDTRPHIVELSSVDGRTWTQLDTVAFDPVPGLIGSARLSADGCFLFVGISALIPYHLYVIARDGEKRFTGPLRELVKAGAAGRFPFAPVLAADLRSMWFVAQDSSDSFEYRLFRGQ